MLNWMRHLDPHDRVECLLEVTEAATAGADNGGDYKRLADVLDGWRRTAEVLSDPEVKAVLLGRDLSPADFVDAPRPE